ncbi:hypothetical protein [Streptomyces sp. NPDC048606]|uniref:hypothetical protein n=1 Tax=Streptomyces sp. NPDC048606 TaxID=3154726 RepID=UPI00343FC948
MSGAQRKLTEHPVLIFLGVIATIIGALAAGKDLFSSDDTPPRAGGSAPASAPAPAPPADADDSPPTPTSRPSPTRTRSVEIFPEPEEETVEPETRPTRSVPSTPGRAAVPTPAARPPAHSGPLIVRIDMGTSGKVGPTTWRARSNPGANTVVNDSGGRLDRGCYVQWTVKRGGEVVQLAQSERCRPPSITLFSFGDTLDQVGAYTLTADITTDWGQKGSTTVAFDVVPR